MNSHDNKTAKPTVAKEGNCNSGPKKQKKTNGSKQGTKPKEQNQAKGKLWIIAAIVVALLLVGGLTWYWVSRNAIEDEPQQDAVVPELQRPQSPLDLFLDSLTEQEKDSLRYYEIEEIPEY